MHQQHDKRVNEEKGSSATLIGSALVGAAVGAAVVLASDPDKRKTMVDKAKETKERVGRAVDEIKKKKDEVVDKAESALREEEDSVMI